MADISLIDPYSAKQESIARQRRMAQALQQQAQAPMEMPQTPGVLISPYAGLAKVLQGAYGGYQEAEADKEYRALAEEARTNQAADFSNVIRALSAPGREGVAGQDFVPDTPAVMAPKIEKGFGGYGMPQEVGQYEMTPAIAGQPAIARQEPIAPGYISPELIASLKDPLMRQFAMAQAMAKLEPKAPISVAAGGTLLDPRTFKPVFTAPAAAQRGVAVGQGQELRDPITGALLATGPAKDAKAENRPFVLGEGQSAYDPSGKLIVAGPAKATKTTESKWEKGQKTVDGKTLYGWYDLTAANYKDSFREGAVPPAGNTKLVEVTRGGKVYYENPEIANLAERQAAAIEKEAAPVKKVRLEVTADDGSTKTLLLDETDPKFAEGFATKGPDYVSITEVNSQGQTVVRQVKKDDAILKTGYVKPLDGFLGQLQAAGVPMDKIQNDPKIRNLVDRYFVKTAGGVAPEDVAGFDLRKAEVVARLRELGIAIPANITGLGLSATPGVLGGAQPASAATPAPPAPATVLPFSAAPTGSTLGKKVPGKGTEILVNGRVVGYAN
jgi:hypothetical protein